MYFQTVHELQRCGLLSDYLTTCYNLASALDSLPTDPKVKLKVKVTRMWANAQRDGRPPEYVAPSVQRRKVWLTPTALPRHETRLN